MNDGEGDVDKLADAAKKKNLVDADGANAATSDDIKTGAEAAKKAARTKGKQAPPQSLNDCPPSAVIKVSISHIVIMPLPSASISLSL